jgi:hypothetical protein
MEWHNGNFMPHTVLTFLYNHHLDSIDPELIHPESLSTFDDPYRPPELITVVLRAAVAGLLKCCDLTWRELSKGAVQDVRLITLFVFPYRVNDVAIFFLATFSL